MKKYTIIFLLIFVSSIPVLALMPKFGLKVGMDKQSFEDLTVFPDSSYNDSLGNWWPSIGALVEISLPLMPLALRGEADYDRKSLGDSSATDLGLTVSGKFSVSPPLSPLGFYLGAGPSLHILSWEGTSENIYGAQLYAGVNLKLGLDIFGEVGYGIMFPSEGSWSQINAKFGMYF
jgi:hypothetical protein